MAIKINAYDVLDQLCARKPSDWSDCPVLKRESITDAQLKFLRDLPVLEIDDSYTTTIWDWKRTRELKAAIGKGKRFIAVNSKGESFYVYTSGYDYVRYGLRVELGADAPHFWFEGGLPLILPVDEPIEQQPVHPSVAEPPKPAYEPPAEIDKEAVKRLILSAEILVKYVHLRGYDEVTKALASEVEDAIKKVHL